MEWMKQFGVLSMMAGALAFGAAGLTGCEDDGMDNDVEEAMDNAEDNMEDAANDAEDSMEDAADSAEDTMEDATN